MEKIVQAILLICKHFVKNFSNYCTLVGTGFILHYIKVIYGFDSFILSIGVVLVFLSFILELNKVNKR